MDDVAGHRGGGGRGRDAAGHVGLECSKGRRRMRAFSFAVTPILIVGYAGVGFAMLIIAAIQWRDIPPFIAALGGLVILFQAGISAWKWIEKRGVEKAKWKKVKRKIFDEKDEA